MINIESFKLPIQYIEHKITDDIIKDDLELIKFKNESSLDTNEYKSVYEYIFEPDTIFSKSTSHLWANYYTTDIDFLTQTQKIIKTFKPIDISYNQSKFNTIYDIYNSVTSDNNFLEKYQYIDISFFKHFNNNETILQSISFVNLTSPLLSLLLPIILLIIPLFIFKLYGLNLSISSYLYILKQVFMRHPIGSVFINFPEASLDKKMYLIFTFIFYIFQMVQNAKSCYKFYKNLNLMYNYLNELNDYIDYTLNSFEQFEKQITNYNKYDTFISKLNEQKHILIKYKSKIENISSFKFGIKNILNTGKAMKCFYMIHDNEELKQSMIYSFGFHGFIQNLTSLNKKFKNKDISSCKFNKSKTKFNKAYYPIIKNTIVKNSYKLNKKMLITGPNASGKTTILKTTLLNILFSQQLGMGFYSKASIKPYTYLHCYLNIPDTSCRDSLFQAEARRCKDIINILNKTSKNENHFCIFDELYSGTNPYEAISSSIALLKYMTKYSNVDYVLTTHFLDVCKTLDNNSNFINCYMDIIEKDDDFEYTYKVLNGISQVKGGVKVLKDLEYPEEIIYNTKQLLLSLKI
jgi:hypothetical protein